MQSCTAAVSSVICNGRIARVSLHSKGGEILRIPTIYIKRGLLLLLIMLTAAFQHTDGAIPSLFGAKAMVLIPLTVVIGMYERSLPGLAFGVIAGALWDFASVRGDGFFSVCLAVTGYLSGVLVTYYLRNNILSALLLGTVSSVGINTLYWFIFIYTDGYEGAVSLLTGFYIPSAVYTLMFIFIYYYLAGLIIKLTAYRKN